MAHGGNTYCPLETPVDTATKSGRAVLNVAGEIQVVCGPSPLGSSLLKRYAVPIAKRPLSDMKLNAIWFYGPPVAGVENDCHTKDAEVL